MEVERNDTATILGALRQVGEQVTDIRAAIDSLDEKLDRLLTGLGRLEGLRDRSGDGGLEIDGQTIH